MGITAQKYSAGNIAKKSESPAGIPEVELISKFDIDLGSLPSDYFYSSETKEQFYTDGYELHEYLPVEDMFHNEYLKVVNG